MTHSDNDQINPRVVDDGSWVLDESQSGERNLTSDERGATGTVTQPRSQYTPTDGSQDDAQDAGATPQESQK